MILKNGDFEADWSEDSNHRCLVFPAGKDAYESDIGNIFVPPNWTFWFRHDPGTWDQPEGRDAWRQNDPRRVRSGEKAYMYFTFYRRHDAGLLQQVVVEPGQRVRLTAWAHAWSNGLDESDGGHLHDGRWSDGSLVGYREIALRLDQISALNGDPQNDANGNFVFQVGIDSKGGRDPFADSVVWSDAYCVYNGYCQELNVEAVAEGNVVTVFLQSTTLWSFNHNDAYWDDVSLVGFDEPLPEPEPEPPEPEPEPPEPKPQPDERGHPRIQYPRTYVLLPPDADEAWTRAVIDATWNDHRYTIGGSADDAGVGDLDHRKIIAVNPDGWPGNLAAFYDEYYPGVEYVPVHADTPGELARILAGEKSPTGILLCQCDPLWKDERFGAWDCGSTICQAGCYVTLLAMAQRFYGIRPDATPVTVDDALSASGYSDCRALWSAMPDALGLKMGGGSAEEAHAHLDAGGCCGAEVLPQTYEHFVFVARREGDRYWMLDPYKCVEGWLDDYYPGVESWRLIEQATPAPSPPPATTFPLRGVHDLAGADWLLAHGGGWCCESVYFEEEPVRLDLERFGDQVRVLVRMNWSWARRDGGQGTLPPAGAIRDHWLDSAVATMRDNPQVWGFIVGNEMNNSSEWPDEPLTPIDYIGLYDELWARKPPGARLIPGAIDPTNAGWDDWRVTYRHVLDGIEGADALAFHCYTHGPDPMLVWRDKKFGDEPLTGCYYDLRMLETQQAIVPARFGDLPQVVTEMNHLVRWDGSTQGWEDADVWVDEAYRYMVERGIQGACLYRWAFDEWAIQDKPQVLAALADMEWL